MAIEEGDDWLLSSRLKTVSTDSGSGGVKNSIWSWSSPRRPRAFFLEAGAIDREGKEGKKKRVKDLPVEKDWLDIVGVKYFIVDKMNCL